MRRKKNTDDVEQLSTAELLDKIEAAAAGNMQEEYNELLQQIAEHPLFKDLLERITILENIADQYLRHQHNDAGDILLRTK